MTIEELKNSIQNKTIDDKCLIFYDKNDNFIVNQYIEEISNIKGKEIEYVHEEPQDDSFFGIPSTTLRVWHVDNIKDISSNALSINNLYVIVDHLTKSEIKKDFKDITIVFDKLEDWQVLDYIQTNLNSLSQEECMYIQKACNNDIHRVDNEIQKLLIFDTSQQKFIFNKMKETGAFSDTTSFSVFDLINSIVNKDVTQLKKIYQELCNMDINNIGLITLLQNNLLNIAKIQLTRNASPQTCNIPEKQFYAVRRSCGKLSNLQVIEMLKFLGTIDKKLKTSQFDFDNILDLIIIKLLGDKV